MLLLSLFFGFFSLINQKLISIMFFILFFIVWFISYRYLEKRTNKSFIVSYIVVNIFWLPLLYVTVIRILFIFENGGMERADGSGSPMAFLLGLTFEQIFFIPLTILFVQGLFFILSKGKS